MTEVKESEVLNFIKRFQNEGTIKTFTEGCCYWFAHILVQRFQLPATAIWYNQVDNHFAVEINLQLYDITGNLGEARSLKGWEPWIVVAIADDALAERIERDCILF